MKIVVFSPIPDPAGEFLKPFCGLLEKEVDMAGVEVALIRHCFQVVKYQIS